MSRGDARLITTTIYFRFDIYFVKIRVICFFDSEEKSDAADIIEDMKKFY